MPDPRSLIAEAEKLLKPQLGFFLFLSGSSASMRKEDATDLYIQAANLYRLKRFQFSRCSICQGSRNTREFRQS